MMQELVGGRLKDGIAHVGEQAGDPSDVLNTLVLLQGDGLSRYIRVQAVQLGNRSLSATTPSERAWGTQRRTSFGPVLERMGHSAGCDGIPFHRGL